MTAGPARIGLAYGTVAVVEHDPAWAAVAATHRATIATALGQTVHALEHVGSTAVPGLPAKPIIDLAVRLVPQANPGAVIDALTAAGYLFRGDKGDQGGLLFVAEPEPGVRTVHLHVLADGDPQWNRYLAVRDKLTTRPLLAARYAQLKTELAGQHPTNRPAYTAAKHAFLTELAADVHLETATAAPPVRRVRALLISPACNLLTIRQTKPGQEIHWVLPGGGIEPGDSLSKKPSNARSSKRSAARHSYTALCTSPTWPGTGTRSSSAASSTGIRTPGPDLNWPTRPTAATTSTNSPSTRTGSPTGGSGRCLPCAG